ncbi:MAG TPA: penicillin-binding protein 2 [Coriobacteriia bacterium]
MSRRRRPKGGGASPRKARRPAGGDRVPGIVLLLAAMLLGIAARLVWVQAVEAGSLAERAERQRLRELVLSPQRGSIFDREGEPLAMRTDAKTIYAVPRAVTDATGTAQALAGILGGAPGDYLKRLQRDSAFAYIARKVDLDRAQAVEALGIVGIGTLEDSRRTYPSGELACQVLGFVGVDDKGIAGIEQQYDSVLAGTPGRVLAERDRLGRPIPGGVISREEPIDGSDIRLTIDKDIQYQAHLELASAVQAFGARGGSVIVMDPRNGEILAMASWPYFNPNDYAKAEAKALRNRVVVDTFEPGSTIKAFTAAAVIDRGLYGPTSVFQLPSTLKVGDRVIHEAHSRGAVAWTLTEIVTKSSNIGAIKLGLALGKNGLFEYFTRFGLAEQTGVDFPGEARGALPPPSSWSQSTIGNIPFGQGLSVSVLQLARGYAVLANGGKLVTPHFLLSASGGTTETVWPVRQAVPASGTAELRSILAQVVKDGTGAAAAVPGYEVAGKTGTAQKAKPGVGYASGAYVASFAGFLPAGDPRVLIIVTLDEPGKAIYGGTVAAPAFSRLAKFTVAHLKIPPTSAVAVTAGAAGAGAKPGAGNGAVAAPAASGKPQVPVLESTSPVR